MRILVFFVRVFAYPSFIVAASYPSINFDHLTVNEGLSHNTVGAILQDHKGIMWFGTENGLNMYDGYNFKVFKNIPGDTTSIGDNFINCLYEDEYKNLWIGTFSGGLYKFNRDKCTFSYFPLISEGDSPVQKNIRSITAHNNKLYVGTIGGIFIIDQYTSKYNYFTLDRGLKSFRVNDIINDGDNGILFSAGNYIYKLNNSSESPIEIDSIEPNSLITDIHLDKPANKIWFITNKKDLYVYNLDRKEFEFINPKDQSNTIFIDSKKSIWHGTRSGLHIYKNIDYNHINSKLDTVGTHLLNDKIIESIYEDRTGIVWIGTVRNGIYYYNPKRYYFKHLKPVTQEQDCINCNITTTFYIDKNNKFWIGTFREGVFNFDASKTAFTSVDNEYLPRDIRKIYGDNEGNLWISSNENGLYCYDLKTRSLKQELRHQIDNTSLFTKVFYDICIGPKGNLWFAVIDEDISFVVYDKNKREFKNYYFDNFKFIRCMEPDSTGIWLGSHNYGIAYFDIENEKITVYNNNKNNSNSLSNGTVYSMLLDKQKRLWVGTKSGLNVLNKADNTFTSFFEKDGLPNNIIYGILQDDRDNLWVSSDNGLSKISFHSGENSIWIESIKNYNVIDGIQGNSFFYNSCYKAPDGKMYFGGFNGFNVFHPDSILENKNIPNIIITDFLLFNTPVAIKRGPEVQNIKDEHLGKETFMLEKDISEVNEIKLNYKQNFLTFRYAAIDYSIPQKNQYACKLEGFNSDWINMGNKNEVTYSFLPPGKYIFRVKGSNNDGVWNETGTSLSVTILPPYWQTFWFRLLIVIFTFFLLYAYIKRRNYKVKKQNKILENKVKERTIKLQEVNAQLEEKQGEILHQNEQILAQKKQVEEFAQRLHESDQAKLRFFTNVSHEFKTPLTLILGPIEKMISEGKNLTWHKRIFQYQLIQKNTYRLFRLINQLLDIRKIDMGSMQLRAENLDIIQFTNNIFDSFTEYTKQKNIDFQFITNDIQLVEPLLQNNVWFDPDKMEKILLNLLSNAFKFTPDGGKISLLLEFKNEDLKINRQNIEQCEASNEKIKEYYQHLIASSPRYKDYLINLTKHDNNNEEQFFIHSLSFVVISVCDTGIGIPKKHLANIFQRFYQVNNFKQNGGSGIGLSFVKELVELQYGIITVKSVYNEGTCFTLSLPIGKNHFANNELIESQQDEERLILNQTRMRTIIDSFMVSEDKRVDDNEEIDKTKPIILVVEDNYDLRNFIKEGLINQYQVIEAGNGKQGKEKAVEIIPNIIISDIMMPEMDGIEMCKILKSDERTCHIPVLLLTAKSTIENQIEGLSTGVEDYITKPFNLEVLRLKLRNIILNRQKLFDKLKTKKLREIDSTIDSSLDKQFIEKITKIIEDELTNSDLNANVIAEKVFMSRSQLYRKFKGFTGKNVSEFIHLVRLNKCAELLEETDLKVSQIAYSVGYQSPGILSMYFKKYYFVSPSQYRISLHNKGDNNV